MENKSKLTLIVDGNWLLMSRLSVLNNRYKDELELCQELKLLMLKSMEIVLRQFPSIDNIIFVSDGGSWRNKIKVPKFLEEAGIEYKGNREKSDEINWELIFDEFEKFISVLSSTGITVSRENGIEGDDWCWYWSTKLNEENTNCIIWTKDKDLTQLVKTNSDNCFTVWCPSPVTLAGIRNKTAFTLSSITKNRYSGPAMKLSTSTVEHSANARRIACE